MRLIDSESVPPFRELRRGLYKEIIETFLESGRATAEIVDFGKVKPRSAYQVLYRTLALGDWPVRVAYRTIPVRDEHGRLVKEGLKLATQIKIYLYRTDMPQPPLWGVEVEEDDGQAETCS